MKSRKLLVCLLALLAAIPAVHAGDDYALFNLGLGGQYWDAKDIGGRDADYDGLWGGNLILRIRPIKYLGIDFRAGVSFNQISDSYRDGNGRRYEEDETFTCVPLEIGVVGMLPLGRVVTLYAGPGAGYYFYNYNESSHSSRHGHHYRKEYDDDTDMKNDFGWWAVAGASFQICRHFSLFGEVRYTDTETSFKDWDDYKIDCSGVGGQIGVIFDF